MKETIIFIHGMCMTYKCWSNFVEFFRKENYNCIALDLLYHSEAPSPDPLLGETSLLDYVKDLEERVKELRLEKAPIIVGHSMGGLLAQMLANRVEVKALVLLAPAGSRKIWSARFSPLRTFKNVMLRWGFWKKPFKFSKTAAKYGIFNRLDDKVQEALINEMVFESGRAAFEIGFWPLDFSKASRVEPTKIKAKILFLSGTYDKIVPKSVVHVAAKRYPNADYKEFPNGHMLQLEHNHQEISQYIDEWLS